MDTGDLEKPSPWKVEDGLQQHHRSGLGLGLGFDSRPRESSVSEGKAGLRTGSGS